MSNVNDLGSGPSKAKVTLKVTSRDKKRTLANQVFQVIFDEVESFGHSFNTLSIEISPEGNDASPITFDIVNQTHRQNGLVYVPVNGNQKQIFFSPVTAEYNIEHGTEGTANVYIDGAKIYSDISFEAKDEDIPTSSNITVQNNSGNSSYKFKVCVPLFNNCSVYVQPNSSGGIATIPTSHFLDGTLLYVITFQGENNDPTPSVVALTPFIKGQGVSLRYPFNGRFNNPIQV